MEARGAESRSSVQLQTLRRDGNCRAGGGGHKGRDVSKQQERGKGVCKGMVQSLGCGRKVGGSSGLYGELQEQNNSCLHLAVEGPCAHAGL